ncbi:MAG: IS66 family insertion sequence element accessory protein TnpB [Rhodobacterales bacterium]|nr:IS66 family insertion sequence element accessory protein TnpB [Rhodobacterales bacterium]
MGKAPVASCKRLEQKSFKWPKEPDGVMRLDPAQFEALLAGRDWRRVTVRPLAPSAVAE